MKTSAPYHHGSNNAERVIRTINSLLRTGSVQQGWKAGLWHTRLPLIQWTLNTMVSESTGQTPFRLFLGREPRMPMDLLMPSPIPRTDTPSVVQQLYEEAWRIRNLVSEAPEKNLVKVGKILVVIILRQCRMVV